MAGTGTSGLCKAMGKLYAKLGDHTAWTGHVSTLWGRPFIQNIYQDKTTHPKCKAGTFMTLGTTDAHVFVGFRPEGAGDDAPFVMQVVDTLVQAWSRAMLARTTHYGYTVFGTYMTAYQWFANCLLVLCFGERQCRVSARAAADNAGAVHGVCASLSATLGHSVAPVDLSDLPIEDIHRSMASAYGAVRGSMFADQWAAVQFRRLAFMVRQWDVSCRLFYDRTRRHAPLAERRRLVRARARALSRLLARHRAAEPPFAAEPFAPPAAPRPDGAAGDDESSSSSDDDDAVDVTWAPVPGAAADDESEDEGEDDVDDEEDQGNDDTEKARRAFKRTTVELQSAAFLQGRETKKKIAENDPYDVTVVFDKRGLRVVFKKEHEDEKKQGVVTFLDVSVGCVHSWTLTKTQNGATDLKLYLVEPPRPGNFFSTGGRGGKGSLRLCKPERGERDIGPLAAVSSSAPFLVLRADTGTADPLQSGFNSLVDCSVYLQARRDLPATFPSPLPTTYQPADREDSMIHLISALPLADARSREKLRGEFAAISAVFADHLAFVSSKGKRGAPIRRRCDSCKKTVYLHYDDRYRLFDSRHVRYLPGEGWAFNHESMPPLHELCIRPRPPP